MVLSQGLRRLGLDLSSSSIESLMYYYKQLREKNQKLGLTALTKAEDILTDLFLDSLSLLPYLNKHREIKRVLDMGTGGGFPGIPIKICRPDLDITLLDSSRKKLGFCRLVTFSLNLTGMSMIDGRAEELAYDARYRESFDLVCSKALARLDIFLEYGVPFLKVGGILAAFKGERVATELTQASQAIKILNTKVIETIAVSKSGPLNSRCLVFVEKLGTTPLNLPRTSQAIKQEPLR